MADDTPPAAPDLSNADPAMIQQLLQQVLHPPQAAVAPQAPVERHFVSLLGEALGGGSQYGSSAEREAAGNRALLSFGTGALAASGYSPVRRTLGEVFAAGAGGAQESLARSGQVAAAQLGAQQEYAQKQQEMQLARIKEAVPLLTLLQSQQQLAGMRGALGKPNTSIGAAGPGGPGTAGADLTGDKAHDLPLIAQRESGGDPAALNYVAREDPTAYARGATASGKYQIVNSTWREGMQLAGLDPSKYATASAAPESVQDQVAGAIYDKYGNKPWQKGTRDWVKDESGRYQLATVRPQPGAPPAAPARTGSQTPPGAPAGPPGVVIGDATQPQLAPGPPGSTGGAPIGIGAALAPPPAVAGTPIPAGRLQSTGKPPGVAAADAILGGVQLAQATPLVRGTGQEAGQSSAVATLAQPGWGATVGSYGGGPTTAPPAVAAPQPATQAQQPPAAPPATVPTPDFQMRSLTPTETAQTSYDLDPAQKANFAVRKQYARTPEQLNAVLKEENEAIAARRKDADAARLTIEQTARKDWQAQTHPSTEAELAANQMQREPGLIYATDNQGKVTATAIPVDPRGVEASKADQTRYQKNYAEPFDQTRPLKTILNEMEALNATIERDPLGGRGGVTSEYARKAQQLLSGLGLSSDTIREGTSSQEAYQALSNQLILRLKAASGTSLGQMSDRDLSFIQSSAPNLSQTPQGRQKVAAALRQIFEYQSRLYDAATDTIHDPSGHYTLRDLNKRLETIPDAIPTLPGPQSSPAEAQAWKDHHKPRRGMAYYGPDGGVHLWGVPEPAQ